MEEKKVAHINITMDDNGVSVESNMSTLGMLGLLSETMNQILQGQILQETNQETEEE